MYSYTPDPSPLSWLHESWVTRKVHLVCYRFQSSSWIWEWCWFKSCNVPVSSHLIQVFADFIVFEHNIWIASHYVKWSPEFLDFIFVSSFSKSNRPFTLSNVHRKSSSVCLICLGRFLFQREASLWQPKLHHLAFPGLEDHLSYFSWNQMK